MPHLYIISVALMFALALTALWAFLKSGSYSIAWPERNTPAVKWAYRNYRWLIVVATVSAMAQFVYSVLLDFSLFAHCPATLVVALLSAPCLYTLAGR